MDISKCSITKTGSKINFCACILVDHSFGMHEVMSSMPNKVKTNDHCKRELLRFLLCMKLVRKKTYVLTMTSSGNIALLLFFR